MQHGEDLGHLKRSIEAAGKALRVAEKDVDQAQVDGYKEKTQYFEKITIGSGAAIAAMVSYLGTHATLYPKWILRYSLVSLGVAMLAALYRNWSFPNYVMASRLRFKMEAAVDEQRCRNSLFEFESGLDLEENPFAPGAPIDMERWREKFAKTDADLIATAKKQIKKQKRLWTGIKFSENLCFVALGTAMVSLVWLALRNF